MALLGFGPPEAPPGLVFLHANGFNARTYRAILEPLGATHRILAPDLRGHGATTLATEVAGRADWLDMRDDLLALLAVLDVRDVVLAGHSMGATTCVLAAPRAGGRVRSMVLFDPVFAPPADPGAGGGRRAAHADLVAQARRRRAVFASRDAALTAYAGRGVFRSWPREMLADYVAAGFRDLPSGEVALACDPAWEASSYLSHGHDTWAALATAPCPARILKAETDSTFRLEGKEAELAALPNVRVETVPGADHFLPMQQPDLVRDLLCESLTRDS